MEQTQFKIGDTVSVGIHHGPLIGTITRRSPLYDAPRWVIVTDHACSNPFWNRDTYDPIESLLSHVVIPVDETPQYYAAITGE